MGKITIFTPTYNRAHLLPNLYNFLVEEKYGNLEWIIVDDGSSDNTKEKVNEFKKENKIDIRYFYQKNQGKHVAYNLGIESANGDLFICIDSDDIYESGSLKELADYWETLNRNDLAGLCYLSRYKNGQLIGTEFPNEEMDSDLISMYYLYNVKGDKGIMFNTSILKRFRFPVFDNEKFMTESVLYGEIGFKYKIRFINKIYEIKEYQKNGLSEKYRNLMFNNPKGALLNYSTIAKYNIKGTMKLRTLIQLIRFTYILNENWKGILNNSRDKFLFILLTPIGWLLSKK